MATCKCSHSIKDHEWRVQRRRGHCNRQCGCAKFRPDTDQPKPENRLLGRTLYGKPSHEKHRLMTPDDLKRRIKDEPQS
jgi:hypothetical protein